MTPHGRLVFIAGSLSWAVAQWLLVWLFARFAGGASAVGEYSLTLAIATPVFIVGQFGLHTVYLSLQTYYSWFSYLILRLGGIVLSVLFLLGYFSFASEADPWLWCAVIFVKCLDAYLDILYARIQRENRLMQVGALNLANSVGRIIVAFLIIWSTGAVAGALFATGVVSVAVAIVAQRLSSSPSTEPHGEGSGYAKIIRAGVPTTIAEGLAAIAIYMPLLFLAAVTDDEAVAGIYATAAYLLTFANLSGAILKDALITTFRLTFEQFGQGPLMRKSHKMVGGMVAIGLLVSPVVIFAGSPVLQFVYGEGFHLSYAELTLLALATIPIAPSFIYSGTLNVLNAYSGQAWIWLVACLFGAGAGALVVTVTDLSPMIGALLVAVVTWWGWSIGVLALTLRAQYQRTSQVLQ